MQAHATHLAGRLQRTDGLPSAADDASHYASRAVQLLLRFIIMQDRIDLIPALAHSLTAGAGAVECVVARRVEGEGVVAHKRDDD
jgi:hypothetical protein